jgi:hypothetical protein
LCIHHSCFVILSSLGISSFVIPRKKILTLGIETFMLALCPRCQRANPSGSAYCWFDGGSLLSAQNGVQKLPREFAFPSGRRCATLEELAQSCRDEWAAARELLAKDVLRKFFIEIGRLDLVRLAQEVMQQPNRDVGLLRLIDGLPVPRVKAAKLDFQPRRFTLDRLPAGSQREIELTLVNEGQGTLQGTVSVSEGTDWINFPDAPGKTEIAVATAREQRIRLAIDASKLKAAQSYTGQLTVVTSGGVAEVPVRFELVAKPFAKAPLQGARTPRELAEKMRDNPKLAGPLLEDGDIERWFAANNWDYPVTGPVAKGIAGVQQFFEAMGLSKPPPLQISSKEFRFTTNYPDSVRFQAVLQTNTRKWVYGQVTSDQPWLKVLSPKVIGPQSANILLEANPTLSTAQPPPPAVVHIVGNGGQKLEFAVSLDVRDIPVPEEPGRWRPVLVFAILFLVLRLIAIPIADLSAIPDAIASAARHLDATPVPALLETGGWLQLPWVPLLAGFDSSMTLDALTQADGAKVVAGEFRGAFIAGFVREVIWMTWWLGPLVALALASLPSRRGNWLTFFTTDLPTLFIAGSIGGVLASATGACAFLAIEVVPHMIWSLTLAPASGPSYYPVYAVIAAGIWAAIGAAAGFVIAAIPVFRRAIMPPLVGVAAALRSAVSFRRRSPAAES